jgi:hypothetical protein
MGVNYKLAPLILKNELNSLFNIKKYLINPLTDDEHA